MSTKVIAEKIFLDSKKEIEEALMRQTVYCVVDAERLEALPESTPGEAPVDCWKGATFIVRDVRERKDEALGRRVLEVRLLEGWRRPQKVWIEK
jgi:hypothetical protein